ncbi:hypothetical protein [Parasphingorhabdus sp.]|uniref:hypothetical protein n=1 Tax=Parasphingorhabdus sp. TaxID=2709688 RepID=UPI0032ED4D07
MSVSAILSAALLHCPMITGVQGDAISIVQVPLAQDDYDSLVSLEVPASPFILAGETEARREWVFSFSNDGHPIDEAEFVEGEIYRVKLLPGDVYLTRQGNASRQPDGSYSFAEKRYGRCEPRLIAATPEGAVN